MVYVTYEDKNEFIKTSYNTNIYIAIFTTAHARIKLLKMMQKLGRNVLYCDTDSVFYNNSEETNGLIKSELGDVLGLWTDELEGKSIDYWCCAQAKDYGYIDNDGKCTGKVKGFRKNAETEEKMTFDSKTKLTMQSIDYYTGETNVIPEKVNINYNQFVLKNNTITTTPTVKQWAFKFDKRIIRKISDDLIDTFPYGY